jgi:hypothetical protein
VATLTSKRASADSGVEWGLLTLDMATHTKVEGAGLTKMISDIRRDFARRDAYDEADNGFRVPHSLRPMVAEHFDAMAAADRLAVLDDLFMQTTMSSFYDRATRSSTVSMPPAHT